MNKRVFINITIALMIIASTGSAYSWERYDRRRHSYENGMKTIFPYFEGKNKPGLMGIRVKKLYKYWVRQERNLRKCMRRKKRKGIPFKKRYSDCKFYNGININKYNTWTEETNTGGLLYGGYVDNEKDIKDLRKFNRMSMYSVWKSALKGPFMIVSNRTYNRYGHKYFEKLAGHKLIKADVTGAIVENNARTLIDIDPEYVKQMINMDYFYVKRSVDDDIGGKSMRKISSIKINKHAIKIAKKKRFRYRNTEFVIRTTKPHYGEKYSAKEDFKYFADLVYNNSKYKITRRGKYILRRKKLKVWQLLKAYRDIRKAYRKDKKQYPNMSLLRAHYLRNMYEARRKVSESGRHSIRRYGYKNLLKQYMGYPVAGLSFIHKMKKLRKKINYYLGGVYEKGQEVKLTNRQMNNLLRKKIIYKHFSFMLGNPNLFRAYFKNLNVFIKIANAYNAGYRGYYSEFLDGIIMYDNGRGDFTMPDSDTFLRASYMFLK